MHPLKFIGMIAALAILTALILRFDPARIGASLLSADPLLVFGGLLLVQVQIVLSALRWRFTAARLGQNMSIGHAVRDYYLGTLLNQVLPGGVAGDAVRAVRSRTDRERGGWKAPAQAVIFERAAGQGVIFAVALAGILSWPLLADAAVPAHLRNLLSAGATVAAIAVLAMIVLLRFPLPFLRPHLAGLKIALAAVFLSDGAWRIQSLLSIAIVASYILMFMLASAAVGAPLPILAAVTVIPLCLMMMLIPATVAGWGVREAAAAALWPLFGHSASVGIAASILYGVLALAGALPGLIVIAGALFGGRR